MSLYDTDTLLAQYLSAVNPESMSKRFDKPATKGVDEAYQDYYPEEYDNIDTTNTGPEIIEDITGDNTKTSDDFINTLLTTGLISGGPLIKIGSGLGLGYNIGANYFGLPTLGQMPDAAYKFGGSLYTSLSVMTAEFFPFSASSVLRICSFLFLALCKSLVAFLILSSCLLITRLAACFALVATLKCFFSCFTPLVLPEFCFGLGGGMSSCYL